MASPFRSPPRRRLAIGRGREAACAMSGVNNPCVKAQARRPTSLLLGDGEDADPAMMLTPA